MAALARWCFRHRLVVILGWVIAMAAMLGGSKALGSAYADSFSLPGTDSNRAIELLQSVSPGSAGDRDTIVWHVDTGSVHDDDVRQRITPMLDQVTKVPAVAGVTSPYGTAGAAQISADGRTAYASVTFDAQVQDLARSDITRVVDLAHAARTDGLHVELGGSAIGLIQQAQGSSTEVVGILAAAVVLVIAFGSLLAMLLPILTAVAALGAGLLGTSLLSHQLSISSLSPTLGALIGLGVGIDYALFVVTRYRTGLNAGLSPEEATVRALNTSGRAVVFAGGTVCIALLGLLVLGVDFLSGVGIAAAVIVVFAVLAAVTLLPALFGVLGMRVLSRRQRSRLAESGSHDESASGMWARWSDIVHTHPRALGAAGALVLVVLAIPFFSLRLGSSDQGNDPASTSTRNAYDLLADGFGPGFNGPLLLVAQRHDAADTAVLTTLTDTVRATPGVAAVQAPPVTGPTGVTVVQVVPTHSPQDQATADLIRTLREQTIPAAVHGSTLRVYVGGQTAVFADFASVISDKLPLFLVVVVGLGFLLLLLAFRSLAVPALAAVMNLLAAAAAFGIVVAIFQWGWGADLAGLGKAGPIEAFLPVMMLAILFGLSMDYQVFLVSRMHEEWVRTRDNSRAVRVGQADTGRVITAAGTIMIMVFLSFVLGGQRVIAEFGLGLSAAVLLDAFVIRSVLVPAIMHSLGQANWWLPGWLDRILPHLSIEPGEDPGSAAPWAGQGEVAHPRPKPADGPLLTGAGRRPEASQGREAGSPPIS